MAASDGVVSGEMGDVAPTLVPMPPPRRVEDVHRIQPQDATSCAAASSEFLRNPMRWFPSTQVSCALCGSDGGGALVANTVGCGPRCWLISCENCIDNDSA